MDDYCDVWCVFESVYMVARLVDGLSHTYKLVNTYT